MHVRILVAFSAALTMLLFAAAWFFVQGRPKVEPQPARHPIGAIYDISGNALPNQQVTVYFDGWGKARLVDDKKEVKKILDFAAGTLTIADFTTQTIRTEPLDPLKYPLAVDRDGAKAAGARFGGDGNERAFPYEKWRLMLNGTDCELWTDNHDRFPIFYGASNGALDVKWHLVNSWIDGGVQARPNFFIADLVSDMPPEEKSEGAETGAGTNSAEAGAAASSPLESTEKSAKEAKAAGKPSTQLKPAPRNLRSTR